jgi:hypothetical protein
LEILSQPTATHDNISVSNRQALRANFFENSFAYAKPDTLGFVLKYPEDDIIMCDGL